MKAQRAGRMTGCLLCLLIQLGAATAGEPPVVPASVLAEVQPPGAGETHVIAWATGPLQREVPVVAVLFGLSPGPERDPLHAQFLVVLPHAGYERVAPRLPSKVLRVGGAEQHFSTLLIGDGRITLGGQRYAPGDPRCCPSLPISVAYRLDGSWLTAVAAELPQCRDGGALQHERDGA